MRAGIWVEVIDRIFLLVAGIPGNLCIIMVYRKRRTGGSTRLYIIVMAVVDFAICLLSPAMIYHKLSQGRYTSIIFCKIFVFGYISLWNLSLLIMVVIAIDRYIKVCHSTRPKANRRRAKITIAFCIVISCASNISFLFFLSLQRLATGEVICSQNSNGQFQGIITGVMYLMSFVTAFVTYGMIYRSVKIHTRVQANLFASRRPDPVCPMVLARASHVAPSANDMTEANTNLRTSRYGASTAVPSVSGCVHLANRQRALVQGPIIGPAVAVHRLAWLDNTTSNVPNNSALLPTSHLSNAGMVDEPVASGIVSYKKTPLDKTTKMMLAVTVIYFLTWLPEALASMFLREVISSAMDKHIVADIVLSFLRDLLSINHVINPVVYGLLNKRFRQDLFKLFKF
ncbi:D(2) dopamine receptor-like [Strongylocentrotus purpuratus]|uniref:G-protein coupled receptors family 1 profile domain-containing protein n=1 Tax=Strongylocentrotus purpuratus TaxID=7668 RepID=A0A7M7NG67_STRPU|nr:D(2) dopamine receptor-like [Strongylocentrotus purpuratus]